MCVRALHKNICIVAKRNRTNQITEFAWTLRQSSRQSFIRKLVPLWIIDVDHKFAFFYSISFGHFYVLGIASVEHVASTFG